MQRFQPSVSLGQEEALPHLHRSDAQNVAEAAFCLGIIALRADRQEDALRYMLRAQGLNPGHEPTRQQIYCLRHALGQERTGV